MAKASRRGVILIEPYKQLRFGVMFLVINLVFSSLVLLVFGYFLWDVYEALSVYFKLDDNQSLMTLSKFGKPILIGSGLMALFILTTLFTSARYTHQIYGPMVSIRRFLDEMLEGKKPAPIKLRSSDQLTDLVEKLNRVAKKFVYSHDQQTVVALEHFVDALNRGEKPDQLVLAIDNPLCELATKLNQLANSR